MSIPFEIPAKFLPLVSTGQLVRYGSILKDVGSGRIVGFLKEAGPTVWALSGVNPILAGGAIAGKWSADIVSHIDTAFRLRGIQRDTAAIIGQLNAVSSTLGSLGLVTSIGTVASVAGLGVSLAGFGLVLYQMRQMESHLDEALKGISTQIEELDTKFEAMRRAELNAAFEKVIGSGHTDSEAESEQHLERADATFQEFRHYYFDMIDKKLSKPSPATQYPFIAGLGAEELVDLYGRFFAVCASELQANFLLNRFAQWRFRHNEISKQVDRLCTFSIKDLFSARAQVIGVFSDDDVRELQKGMRGFQIFANETKARIETAKTEVDYVQKNDLGARRYLEELSKLPDEGVVLLTTQDGAGL